MAAPCSCVFTLFDLPAVRARLCWHDTGSCGTCPGRYSGDGVCCIHVEELNRPVLQPGMPELGSCVAWVGAEARVLVLPRPSWL